MYNTTYTCCDRPIYFITKLSISIKYSDIITALIFVLRQCQRP